MTLNFGKKVILKPQEKFHHSYKKACLTQNSKPSFDRPVLKEVRLGEDGDGICRVGHEGSPPRLTNFTPSESFKLPFREALA